MLDLCICPGVSGHGTSRSTIGSLTEAPEVNEDRCLSGAEGTGNNH